MEWNILLKKMIIKNTNISSLDISSFNLYNINVKKTLSFVIKYGDKDPYEFVVKMEKDPFSKSGRKVAYVESGVGESLWENEKSLLIDYINGKEVNKKDKEDFDQKLNLSFYNQYLIFYFINYCREIIN